MNKKQIFLLGLDIAILGASALCIDFTYNLIENTTFRIGIIFLIASFSIFLIVKEIYGIYMALRNNKKSPIPYIIGLIGEKEQVVSVWDLNKQIGLLIGKSTEQVDANIDLGYAEFANYIDNEHATLNYTRSGWWIEDLGSTNGTSLKHAGKEILLSSGAPNRLLPGDVIIIGGYTRLAVK